MRYPAFWQRRGLLARLFWPLGWLVCAEAARRRRKAAGRQPECPVIVVGNLTVGGTGKTPVVIALVEALRRAGHTPGVISRGFGVKVGIEPVDLAEAVDPSSCGDEPWLIHQRTGAPVVVHPYRREAARQLKARYPEVDVIVSDDGLQHHRLARTIEWVVVDGHRGLGNGWCLPAGPLRESPAVMDEVDAVLVNGAEPARHGAGAHGVPAWRIDFRPQGLLDRFDQTERPITDLAGREVIALAGIGNPERFFAMLEAEGVEVEAHPLDDHAAPTRTQARAWLDDGRPVVMTEKDAVKWPEPPVRPGQLLVVRGGIDLPPALIEATLKRLET
ncbi:tetraacyldisaccharide 4'-kinase [Guyparkeria hydrothermalis]|uniref:tetraacyldisaccharide 4'-kinase n=1 Tax=Guyparkeria hydrothermalis TaxID=923 RepID=UPI002020CD78|nr:tetraacyldisaccharide 4'-kinase [Guyparkeria hydrothermalis]MCL7750201.1 tetraacyldisaccharide 4'-kinase [Guyparkeria hydrothermalis]